MVLLHRKVKYTIIMFQSKTYLNTDSVWITILVCVLVDVDMSFFNYYGLANKITLIFGSMFHTFYYIKCLLNNDYPK